MTAASKPTPDGRVPLLPWWLRVLAWLPLPLLYALCRALAWCARHLGRSRWRVTMANLRTVYPALGDRELRRLAVATTGISPISLPNSSPAAACGATSW